jgi:prefoldin subunit 5
MRGFMGDNRMALMGMGAGILDRGLAGGPGGAFQGSQIDYSRAQDMQARNDEQSERARRDQAVISLMTQQGLNREQAQTYVDAGMGGAYLESTMGGGGGYQPLSREEAMQMGLPEGAVYQRGPDGRITQIGGGGTNVTVNNASDPVAIEEIVKDTVELSTADIQAGQTATRASQTLTQLNDLLADAPQGLAGGLASVATNLGIPVEGGDEVAAAQALLNQLTPQQRPPGSGPMSDADLRLFRESLPRIINQPGANQIILRGMQALNQYDQARGNIAEQYQEMLVTGTPQAEALRFYRSQIAQLNASTPSLGQMLGQAGMQATQPSQPASRLTPGPDGVLEYR